MNAHSKSIEELEAEVPAASTATAALRFNDALRAGYSVLIAENGKLFRVDPNGKRTFIKVIAPRINVKVGMTIRLK